MLHAVKVMQTEGSSCTCKYNIWILNHNTMWSSKEIKWNTVEIVRTLKRFCTSAICRTIASRKWVLPPHCIRASKTPLGTNPNNVPKQQKIKLLNKKIKLINLKKAHQRKHGQPPRTKPFEAHLHKLNPQKILIKKSNF